MIDSPKERNSLKLTEADLKEAQDELALNGTLRELFGIAVYKRNLVLMVVIWSFGAFSFFVVPFYIGTLPLNIYMMSTATAIGEIIASVICLFITHG